eukprot:CAMPEP_0180400974 /NCGR_PEP_ID=MMETSP0989-20121125/38041_1 /TAXON_ID=697907 /ORGANISM="non described non described, Strain CCMP2293" /LENGTH=196 /DNA_ID=CAMNT_0022403905 /DNA_START=356 /DNA_END=943 /DNA_ORIENTATION=-
MAESQVSSVSNVQVQALAAPKHAPQGLDYQKLLGALPPNVYQAFPMLQAGLTSMAKTGPATASGALGTIVKGMGSGSMQQMMSPAFDFWSEEENRLFVSAVESQNFPPEWKTVSARVGSKTVEQCSSYAAFYYKTLQHRHQQAATTEAQPPSHLTAAEVYTFLGVSAVYADFLRSRPPASASDHASASNSSSNGQW